MSNRTDTKKKRFVCLDRSLLDEDLDNLYIDEGEKVLAGWQTLGTERVRIAALWRVMNLVLARAGIPPVRPSAVAPLKKPLAAVFELKWWRHMVDPEGFQRAQLSREEGIELLAFAYHEARHVEQFWLMARWRVAKDARTVMGLRNEVEMPPWIARLALACPLRPGHLTEATLVAWYKNYRSTMMREHTRLIDAFQREGGPDVDAGPARGVPQTAAEQQALDRYHLQVLQDDAEMAHDWLKTLIRKRKPLP